MHNMMYEPRLSHLEFHSASVQYAMGESSAAPGARAQRGEELLRTIAFKGVGWGGDVRVVAREL